MAALLLNKAPHFVFYYRFCNSLDFYCALHPKNLFLSFSRPFCDYQGDFFKIQGQFKDKMHFFRIPGVFQDQGHFQGLFKVCANPVVRFQSITFDYQCNSVSSTAVKFRNHAAASQHSLPILITDGEKIILLYAKFTYISSQCQKYLQSSILQAETGSLAILFNSIMFKIGYGNSLYQLFWRLIIFICF